jgi:DNA-binding response OmpR family regulator
MSILTGKHVLVVGEETSQITKIEAALITYGADIATTTCVKVDPVTIQTEHTGLILLNHLHDGVHCKSMLSSFREHVQTKDIPVFVLVQNDQAHIGEVLLLGAADYFVSSEDIHSVIDKIKTALGVSEVAEHHSVIDLSTAASDSQVGTRVFAVEDDPLLQNLLATRFEKSGLVFEMASNGIELVQKVAAFKPQILIMDLMLPGEDGFVLLKKIKSNTATAAVPVLIFSNKDSQEDRKLAAELGATGFYVKAMTDLSELLDIINVNKSRVITQ